MTTPDTHPEENDNRTGSSVSRRSYLAGIVAGSLATATSTGAAASTSIQPNEFLISEAQLPESFTPLPSIDVDEAFDAVRSPGDGPTPRDRIACNGFWAGNDQDEPLWVAGSSACVGVSPDEVTAAAETISREYSEFIDEYDAETRSHWHFNRQYEKGDTFREWRTGIYIGLDISSEELFEMADKPKLIDVFRIQHIDNTLIGTVLFGPTEWDWSYAELLDRLTGYQRDRALSLTEADSTTTSGEK
jgi:hypothetical protein